MNPRDQLIAGCEKLGVGIDDAQADAFMSYMDELVKWNRKINLTAITKPSEIISGHFLDSLSLVPLLPQGAFRAADIGAGAGLPGLALKIIRPDMGLTLVEPQNKKATFLRHIIRTLGISDTSVEERRVEELAPGHAGAYDVVLSRAFTEPASLTALAGPLLKPDGWFVLSMGPSWDGTAPEGWRPERTETVEIPYIGRTRTLVVLTRNRN